MDLARALLNVMPDLEQATSLGAWRMHHGSEKIAPFVRRTLQLPNEPDDTWCATSSLDFAIESGLAHFDRDQLGDGYTYTHDWLIAARKIDPDGNGGDLAFRTLMQMGFHTGVGCAGGSDYGFESVVEEGVKYIRDPLAAGLPPTHTGFYCVYD